MEHDSEVEILESDDDTGLERHEQLADSACFGRELAREADIHQRNRNRAPYPSTTGNSPSDPFSISSIVAHAAPKLRGTATATGDMPSDPFSISSIVAHAAPKVRATATATGDSISSIVTATAPTSQIENITASNVEHQAVDSEQLDEENNLQMERADASLTAGSGDNDLLPSAGHPPVCSGPVTEAARARISQLNQNTSNLSELLSQASRAHLQHDQRLAECRSSKADCRRAEAVLDEAEAKRDRALAELRLAENELTDAAQSMWNQTAETATACVLAFDASQTDLQSLQSTLNATSAHLLRLQREHNARDAEKERTIASLRENLDKVSNESDQLVRQAKKQSAMKLKQELALAKKEQQLALANAGIAHQENMQRVEETLKAQHLKQMRALQEKHDRERGAEQAACFRKFGKKLKLVRTDAHAALGQEGDWLTDEEEGGAVERDPSGSAQGKPFSDADVAYASGQVCDNMVLAQSQQNASALDLVTHYLGIYNQMVAANKQWLAANTQWPALQVCQVSTLCT